LKNSLALTLIILLALSLFAYSATADDEPEPSVRYTEVEEITYITDFEYGINEDGSPLLANVTHFTYTCGLWKVAAWADRAYFTAYVERGGFNVVVANWSVGFSVSGGLQGIYIDYQSDLLQVHTIMAEFPFRTVEINHPIDGLRIFRLYRMHFYFNNTLFEDEIVTIAADYMQAPIVENPQYRQIMNAPVAPSTGDVQSYKIIDTNPDGFTFYNINMPLPEHVVPETPFGTVMAVVACVAGLSLFITVKRRKHK
jgi:hypothetical protein